MSTSTTPQTPSRITYHEPEVFHQVIASMSAAHASEPADGRMDFLVRARGHYVRFAVFWFQSSLIEVLGHSEMIRPFLRDYKTADSRSRRFLGYRGVEAQETVRRLQAHAAEIALHFQPRKKPAARKPEFTPDVDEPRRKENAYPALDYLARARRYMAAGSPEDRRTEEVIGIMADRMSIQFDAYRARKRERATLQ